VTDHYRVVFDDDKGCTKCGHGLFYTIVSGTVEDEMGVGTSWSDKEAAEDICDLMNMAFDAGVESERALENEVKEALR
jgi:hypothetical protein